MGGERDGPTNKEGNIKARNTEQELVIVLNFSTPHKPISALLESNCQ